MIKVQLCAAIFTTLEFSHLVTDTYICIRFTLIYRQTDRQTETETERHRKRNMYSVPFTTVLLTMIEIGGCERYCQELYC